MAAPDNPPIAPTYVPCEWIGPLNAAWDISHWDWPTLPFGEPDCPPTVGGVPVAGRENFTQKCGSGAGVTCWDPSFVAQRTEALTHGYTGGDLDTSIQPYPACSREWDDGTCFHDPAGFYHDYFSFEGHCPTCPSSPVVYTLNPDDCLCYNGAPCPEGTCYCELTADCVPCTGDTGPPACDGLFDCQWDPAICNWACSGVPDCLPGEVFDLDTCLCVSRCTEEDECWCELTETCVDCSFTPGDGEHDCVWNTETCVWDCEECPDGQCWCDLTSTCVDCTDPECKAELHCRWDQATCVWICDDTDVKCAGRTWLGPPDCHCEGGGGCDLAELGVGWLVRAYASGADIYVGTSRTAGVTWEDVLVSSDGDITSSPSLMVDNHDTVWVAFHKMGPDPTPLTTAQTYIYRSDDLGQTWIYASEGDETYWKGRTFPELCWTPEYALLGSPVGVGLVFDASIDGWTTHETSVVLAALGDAQQAQRCMLRLDRRGLLHVAYEQSAGAVVHYWSGDGAQSWSDPATTLASDGTGADPSYALGIERGILAWWADGALTVATTTETGSEYEETVVSPVDTEYQPQQLGVLVDRRENAWILGMVDYLPAVTWSGNVYLEWREPV